MNTGESYTRLTDRIMDDAYELAAEDGWIKWLPPTLQDPGCYDKEVDLICTPVEYGDFGIVTMANALATVGTAVVFNRTYFVEGPDISFEDR